MGGVGAYRSNRYGFIATQHDVRRHIEYRPGLNDYVHGLLVIVLVSTSVHLHANLIITGFRISKGDFINSLTGEAIYLKARFVMDKPVEHIGGIAGTRIFSISKTGSGT